MSTSLAEQQQVHLEQRAEEPEIGDAEDGQPQRAVVQQVPRAGDDFAERIPAEGAGGAGGGHARDLKLVSESEPPRPRAVTTPIFQGCVLPGREQEGADGGAQHDRHEGAHFEQARWRATDRVSGSISGTMPYFAGLKMVECSAIRNSTTQHQFDARGEERGEPERP